MERFTKSQMFDELCTIFLFEADHLLRGAGPDMALAFIGFVAEEYEYCVESPHKVDLSRFQITGSFERGYEYAFRPSVTNTMGDREVQDLLVFMKDIPRTGGILSGGETRRFMTPEGYCQTVADTVFARWKLESNPAVTGSHTFTTRELALLANMTEGAVRNAIADRSSAGLPAIPGSKPVSVEYDEAWPWLSNRRGFIPTPERPLDDRFLSAQLHEAPSAEALGKLVERILRAKPITLDEVAASIGWDVADLRSWCTGSFVFDVTRARALSDWLDLDAPLFIGKALELSLRRDALGSGARS